MLAAAGADFLGFPLRLAVHREDLTEAEAATVIRALPAGVATVLITYLETAAEVAEISRFLGVGWVQIHGAIALAELQSLRRLFPDLGVIKSLVVRADNRAELERTVADCAPCVDAFITDTFDPATGACGATGLTHDWQVSRRLVELSPVPVILAGGLTPDNVAAAIRAVRPAAVDVHTGVEDSTGAKDPGRVRRFVAAARAAFAAAT